MSGDNGYESERIVGDSTLSPGNELRISPQRLLLQRLLDYGITQSILAFSVHVPLQEALMIIIR